MSGKQIFWGILILLIIIKDPQAVSNLVTGVVNLFTQPGG